MITLFHFSALSRVTLASPSISLELLTRQEIVLQESRRRPDPLHALPQSCLRNKWWIELNHALHISRLVHPLSKASISISLHIVANAVIIFKPRLIGDIPIKRERKPTILRTIFRSHDIHRLSVERRRRVARVDVKSQRILFSIYPLVRRIRWIKQCWFNIDAVSFILRYSKRRKLEQDDISYVAKARKVVAEMIDEWKCEPEGEKVEKEIDVLQTDVVLNCVFDYERIMRRWNRKSFINVWEN